MARGHAERACRAGNAENEGVTRLAANAEGLTSMCVRSSKKAPSHINELASSRRTHSLCNRYFESKLFWGKSVNFCNLASHKFSLSWHVPEELSWHLPGKRLFMQHPPAFLYFRPKSKEKVKTHPFILQFTLSLFTFHRTNSDELW